MTLRTSALYCLNVREGCEVDAELLEAALPGECCECDLDRAGEAMVNQSTSRPDLLWSSLRKPSSRAVETSKTRMRKRSVLGEACPEDSSDFPRGKSFIVCAVRHVVQAGG